MNTYEKQRAQLKAEVKDILLTDVDVYEELTSGNETLRAVVAIECVEIFKRTVHVLSQQTIGLAQLLEEDKESDYIRGRLDSTIHLKLQMERLVFELLGLKEKEEDNALSGT